MCLTSGYCWKSYERILHLPFLTDSAHNHGGHRTRSLSFADEVVLLALSALRRLSHDLVHNWEQQVDHFRTGSSGCRSLFQPSNSKPDLTHLNYWPESETAVWSDCLCSISWNHNLQQHGPLWNSFRIVQGIMSSRCPGKAKSRLTGMDVKPGGVVRVTCHLSTCFLPLSQTSVSPGYNCPRMVCMCGDE